MTPRDLSLLAFVLLAACAAPAKPEAMVPTELDVGKRHPHSVSVAAQGGRETSALSSSKISNEDFVTALRTALEQSGTFSSVLTDDTGTYKLDVAIIDLDQPAMGFDMTVTMTASWRLRHAATGKVVFDEFIDTSHTATVGEAFAGIKRLRYANEGAARKNIAEGIRRLSRLSLPGTRP